MQFLYEHVFLKRLTFWSPSEQLGQTKRSMRFSPTSLLMPMHSPWNQSSHMSHEIMNR